MVRIPIIALVAFANVAAADVYKCTINGKTSYSDVPCSGKAESVSARQDAITDQQRREAQVVGIRNTVQLRGIEAEKAADAARQVRQVAAANAEERRRQAQCESYMEEVRSAQRDLRTYKYHEGIIADAKDREKSYSAKHRSECATW